MPTAPCPAGHGNGDLWKFGPAHAVLRHAQREAKEGARAAGWAFGIEDHQLGIGWRIGEPGRSGDDEKLCVVDRRRCKLKDLNLHLPI